MLNEKERAVCRTTAPRCRTISKLKDTTKAITRSSPKLKNQIGILLLFLQTPLNFKQKENGWQLFGIMLQQYVDLRYGRAE